MAVKRRVMVDANILVAGSIWPRFPYAVLQHALNGDFQLCLSSIIIEEARKAVDHISPARLSDFEDFLIASAFEQVDSPSTTEIEANLDLVRDPKDVHVALAAIAAKVDFLVSQDRDLTDSGQTTECLHQRVRVLLPAVFLREQMNWTSEALENIRKRNWEDLDEPT
ncbi:MAG: putative toxin-antitoxin system toxin component, PIN family [bacterium]|nr:putative toxin-antitoxin system toxin component, PIN family [bacterium]